MDGGPVLHQEGDVSELYDRWSGSYDADPNLTRDLAGELLRDAAGDLSGLHVLELGCGTGLNTEWLAARAASVFGVDFSPGMLEQARARTSAPNVRLVRHDVLDPLPMADASFDVVVISLVLEHVPSVAPVLAEAARVLRAGGGVLLCEYHPYRQLAGGQARFRRDTGEAEVVRIPAYLHMVGEYVRAALDAGLVVRGLDERRAPGDAPDAPPRVLFLRLTKP